jgi:hypothetical protein
MDFKCQDYIVIEIQNQRTNSHNMDALILELGRESKWLLLLFKFHIRDVGLQ